MFYFFILAFIAPKKTHFFLDNFCFSITERSAEQHSINIDRSLCL